MPPAAPTKEQKADSIKVFLRVRPLMGRELAESHACKNLVCDPNDDKIVRVRDPRLGTDSNAVEKKFAFHQVFPPQATQEQVYNAFAKDAVDDALNGYHGVMFVYGQTGSGKTFTMSNEEPGKEGMLQRSMRAVWQKINADREYEYVCSVSYVQLYNEMLTDMLEGNTEMNSVRLSGVADRRNDVMLVNDTTNQPIAKDVASYEETIGMFRQGVARRVSASTEMNSVSSRSHTVFTLYIKKQARTEAAASGGGNLPTSLEGRLVICDLAGSERVKKTDAKGQQLNEANHINGSLLVLGRVVAALTDAKASQHVPYRESKLTRLLQYSLSGWGKTRLVVNVSPSDDNTDETLGAIAFGQRAIQIKQAAEKHATLDYKALYLELQRQTDMSASIAMKDLITAANAEKQAALAEYADRVKMLEAEIELLNSDIAKKDILIAELSQGGASAGSAAAQGTAASVAVTPQRQQSFSTPGGDGNSFALSPNGSSLVEGSTLQIFVTKMKQQLTSRDERLAEVTRENLEIKQKLAQSEQNLLTIASKLRTHMAVSQSERAFYEKTITELSAKADSGKGVEYLNPNGAQDDDEEDRNAGSNFSASSPTLDEASPSLEQENKNLLAALRVLHARLNESQAYNRTARRAIRMLASDLEAAQRASGAASH